MNNHVERFYNLLMRSPEEINKIQEDLKKVKSEKDLMNLIELKIIPIAREKGIDLTKEDLISYEKESISKLSEEDLLNVSGGISFKGKKIVSLFLAGINLSSNLHQASHAVVPMADIMSYTKNITENQKNQLSDKDQDTSEKSGLSLDELSKSLDGLSNSEDFEESLKKTDIQYILDALNLLDPYIYNLTGTTAKFRFYDGYKQEISAGKEQNLGEFPKWDYKQDKGEGSPNFMRCLFPSSTGILTDTGGSDRLEYFTKDCNPTPELIAQIVGYIHNYIRTNNEEASKKLKNIVDSFERGNYSLKKQADADNFFQVYLGMNKETLTSSKLRIKSTKSFTYTILFLLKNAEKMVKDQELGEQGNSEKTVKDQKQDGQSTEKILPKYTTEKMLMSYFIQHFNNKQEVEEFYKEAKRVIKPLSQVNEQDIANSSKRLENINEILKKIKIDENSPYKEKLQENGDTKVVQKLPEGGVTFSQDTPFFQDCAEIAIRHIINLLIYNKENKWNNIVKEEEINKDDYEEILNAIKNNGKVSKDHTLKERLKFFFYYQSKHNNGADAVDIEARSFWNYVVSNMDSNVENEMFNIVYRKEGNVIRSGFLNMLKMVYNIAFALKGKTDNSDTAKNEIIKLEEAINSGNISDLDNILKSTAERTLSLIDKNIEISSLEDIDVLEREEDQSKDCFGEIKFNKFSVTHILRHACVKSTLVSFVPFTESENDLENFLKDDSIAQLLSKFSKTNNIKTSVFNNLFCLKTDEPVPDTQFYNNFKFLKSLKKCNQEAVEENRVKHFFINEWCGKSNIKIKYGKKDTIYFSILMFKNYVKDRENFKKLFPGQEFSNFVKKNLSNDIFLRSGIKFYYMVNEDDNNDITVWPLLEDNREEITISSTAKVKEKGENSIKYNVSNIGKLAFSVNKTLKKVKIKGGESLTIENGSFAYSNIEKVDISGNVKKLNIEKGAFEGSASLQELKLPDKIEEINIDEGAFSGSGLKKFEIPSSVTKLTIGNKAFFNTKSLETFDMPDSVKNLDIGRNSFLKSGLTRFKVPSGVTKLDIGNCAFKDTALLENFEMPENLEQLNIGNNAFFNSGLSQFKVPASVTELTIGKSAFYNAKSLKTFEILSDIKKLNINEGAFSASGIKDIIVPGNKVNVGIGAFSICPDFNSIEFLGEEISLGKNCFDGCDNFKTAKFPNAKKLEVESQDLNKFRDKFNIPTECNVISK